MARRPVRLLRPAHPVPPDRGPASQELQNRGVRRRAGDHRQGRARRAGAGRARRASAVPPLPLVGRSGRPRDRHDGRREPAPLRVRGPAGPGSARREPAPPGARGGGSPLDGHEQRGIPGFIDRHHGGGPALADLDLSRGLHAAVPDAQFPVHHHAHHARRRRGARGGPRGARGG